MIVFTQMFLSIVGIEYVLYRQVCISSLTNVQSNMHIEVSYQRPDTMYYRTVS